MEARKEATPKKTLPSLRGQNRPGFVSSDDIYADTGTWSDEDMRMCYRYVTHLVGRASTRKRYANELRTVRFDELSVDVLEMFRRALDVATLAREELSEEQRHVLYGS